MFDTSTMRNRMIGIFYHKTKPNVNGLNIEINAINESVNYESVILSSDIVQKRFS